MFYGQYRVLRADWSLKTTEEAGGPHAIAKGIDTLKYNPYSHSAYYKIAYHYLNENKIRDALETGTKDYIGANTFVTYSATEHEGAPNLENAVIVQIKDGKPVLVK
jgi:hypothetical protein